MRTTSFRGKNRLSNHRWNCNIYGWLKNAIDTSVQQLEETVADVGDSVLLPRSIWTGYNMDFLCSQLQREPVTFKDSLRMKPVKDALGSR